MGIIIRHPSFSFIGRFLNYLIIWVYAKCYLFDHKENIEIKGGKNEKNNWKKIFYKYSY
jgi:hypothetical protein